jgi:hypothetical protein
MSAGEEVASQLALLSSARPTGRPQVDMRRQLQQHMWEWQTIPSALLASDKQQYYWKLPCNKHLALQTIQATLRQLHNTGQVSQCYRCSSFYSLLGPKPSVEKGMSYFAQYTWMLLDFLLVQPTLVTCTPLQPCTGTLTDKDVGYITEAKVLCGSYGAADIYVPVLDLIIQVDGHFHDRLDHINRDQKFDAECIKQHHNLLRLHYQDIGSWGGYIKYTMQLCLMKLQQPPTNMPPVVVYTESHQQWDPQLGPVLWT